jgi:hypothetical protein
MLQAAPKRDGIGMDEREHSTMLPPVATEAGARASFVRIAPGAAFLSQLIAAREQLSPQRARRRTSSGDAAALYAAGSSRGVRRLPPGYRTSHLA